MPQPRYRLTETYTDGLHDIDPFRHSRESGNPASFGRTTLVSAFAGTTISEGQSSGHWVPAEACPRMLESGAGTTISECQLGGK